MTPAESPKHGLPPGSLVHVGERRTHFPTLSVIQFKEDMVKEYFPDSVDALAKNLDQGCVTWINIDGIHDARVLEEVGKVFQLELLSLEDIMNTASRAKYEEFDSYVFILVKDLFFNTDCSIGVEQISFVLRDGLLITFQEEEGDVFENVRTRIRTSNAKVRTRGADYLAYSLLDAIVDNFYLVTDQFDQSLDELEEELTAKTEQPQVQKIQDAKKRFTALRRAVLPMREVIFSFHKTDNPIIKKKTHLYIRDLHDHVIQVNDTLEQSRDKVSGLMGIYLSGTNTIMNNIMKTLTIVSTIFMALSLIAGIYGMNFKHMPETEWQYGYFIVLGIMGVIAIALILFFRRKKWLD